MFRNLRFYRLSSPWPDSEQELSERLSEHLFTPCGAFAERSAGWEAPGTDSAGPLCRRLHGADLLQLRTQSRVLPAAAVKEVLEERVAEYRERMSQDPLRGDLRRLKEETRDGLLPKALLKSDRTRACMIHAESVLAVDAPTDARAEWFLDHLRSSIKPLQCVPLVFTQQPADLLTRIFLGESPLGFGLGRECRMQDVADHQSIAIWRDSELSDASIRRHIAEGMQLTHLEIVFDGVLQCVVDQNATISKLGFHKGDAVDTPDQSPLENDPQAEQDVQFVLLVGAITRLLADLKKLLGGYA